MRIINITAIEHKLTINDRIIGNPKSTFIIKYKIIPSMPAPRSLILKEIIIFLPFIFLNLLIFAINKVVFQLLKILVCKSGKNLKSLHAFFLDRSLLILLKFNFIRLCLY